jgi:hypothetical protein
MAQLLTISLIKETQISKYHHQKIKSRIDAIIGQENGFTYYKKKSTEINFFYTWQFQLPVALPSGHIP